MITRTASRSVLQRIYNVVAPRNAFQGRQILVSTAARAICVSHRPADRSSLLNRSNFSPLTGTGYVHLHKTSSLYQDLSYEDLIALMRGSDIQLVDVREPEEIKDTGMIPGAINIPLGQVKLALQLPDEIFQERFKCEKPQKYDSNLVFYGLGPIKSGAAIELARRAGYMNAREYSKGWEDWSKRRLD